MMRLAAITLLAALALPAHADEAKDVSCADYASVDTNVGHISNNVWDKQAAGAQPYRQCIRTRGGKFGWSWQWPANPGNRVFAYPETVMGWKPWNGGVSTFKHLPIQISAINTFTLSYNVETTAHGKHNLSTSLWIIRSGRTSAEPRPKDVTAELMVWTDGFDFHPAGNKIADTMIDGIPFEVWSATNWSDVSKTNTNHWNYIAYRSKMRKLDVTLDIRKILADAAHRGIVDPAHYVASVELGNEVMSGTGETWINSMSLTVE
jgi:hypothetical protein